MNHLRRSPALCSFLLLLPLAAGAQTATLVRDVGQGDHPTAAELGNIASIAAVPGRVFFSASMNSADNREMWTSDGTAEGTYLLKDACPGTCSSEPHVLGTLNGIVFWAARSDEGWFHLWRSDGTRAGTYRLVEERLRIDGDSSYEIEPVATLAGGALSFVSSVGSGADTIDTLWRTDGTPAGTRKIRTLEPRQAIQNLLSSNGKVFLILRGVPALGDATWSLWTTDGTAEGTRPVRDFPSQPRRALTAGGHLFFILTLDFETGQELWASDGTEAGTRAITDFVPRTPFGDLNYSDSFRTWVSGGHLFFVADDVVHGEELYESDGTPAGTRRITDFGTPEPRFDFVTDLGSRTVFTADDDLGHVGVWSTTGDPAGTQFLPLPCGTDCRDEIRHLVKVGPRAVFFVQADYGIKILSTDGTPAGTRLLRDGCPDDCDVVLPNLPAEVAALPFATRLPDILWITDGTPAGTRKRASLPGSIDASGYSEISAGSFTMVFADYRSNTGLWALGPGRGEPRLVKAPAINGPGFFPQNLANLQGNLAFTACDGDRFFLWRSAGTEATTAPALELAPPSPGISYCVQTVEDGHVASLGSVLLFLRDVDFSRKKQLWRTDGTPGGTQPLTPADLAVGQGLAVGTGRVYFWATTDQTVSVWTSDGTSAGTLPLATWPVGGQGPSALTAVGNELYFFFGDYEKQLWKSDGTPQGTKKVLDDASTSSTLPPSFTRVGSAVYYVSRGSGYIDEVWRTDGTAAGTRPLGEIAGMDRDPYPSDLIAFQGSLYFFAWTARDIRGLWRSDGTAAGTVLLAEFPEPGHPAYPVSHQLTLVGGKLFFVEREETGGTELWVTDGTAAGTRRVEDIRPGSGSLSPDDLTAAGGRLFFTAGEETYGRELWVSDGTAAGTRLVQDIAPFGASSEPEHLTVAGDRLYFQADDWVSGRELWSLPLSGPAGCQTSSTRLCLNGGRYQVEAAWRTDTLSGHATAVALSGDTGYFWFFQPSNVEAVVKVLDGQGVNGHVWVFYGALSDVDYTITVTDTQTGVTRRYHNPAGQLASVGDTKGFGPLGAYSAAPGTIESPPSPLPLVTEKIDRAATAPCQESARRLCLNDDRFAVEVAWKDFQGNTGKGTAVPLTSDTGTFWFFNAANVELVVKILDGRPVNSRFWVFYGALSNVEYTVTVTDTGKVKTYKNPSGRFASVADTNAF